MATINRTTIPEHDASNDRLRRFYVITGPASYATGGDAFAPADARMGAIHLFSNEHPTNGTDLRLVRFDYTNNKIKWFDLAGAEIANGTDLSTYSFRVEIIGR